MGFWAFSHRRQESSPSGLPCKSQYVRQNMERDPEFGIPIPSHQMAERASNKVIPTQEAQVDSSEG